MARARMFVLVLLFGAFLSRVCAQDVARPLHSEPIPKDHYKTWSLFLVCNPRWMADDRASDLTELYKAFEAFGETIGPDNLAVWFWKNKDQSSGTVEQVDIQRSSAFCAAYGLPPSRGPYIFTTSSYPDISQPSGKVPANSGWFELGAMKPSEISELLAHLADRLVAKPLGPDVTTPPAATITVAPVPWDVRLLGAVQQLLNRLGCAWTFKLETEGVQAELKSCTQQQPSQ